MDRIYVLTPNRYLAIKAITRLLAERIITRAMGRHELHAVWWQAYEASSASSYFPPILSRNLESGVYSCWPAWWMTSTLLHLIYRCIRDFLYLSSSNIFTGCRSPLNGPVRNDIIGQTRESSWLPWPLNIIRMVALCSQQPIQSMIIQSEARQVLSKPDMSPSY